MSPEIIKLIDRLAGPVLIYLLGSNKPSHAGLVGSVLLIRPGGIGDAVILAPAVTALKNTYPHTHITILAEQRNSGVFPLIAGVDEIFCYDRPREFFQALRGHYDIVIDTEQWYRLSAVVARLVRAPVRIGYGTNERRRMFTHEIQYDQNAYERDNFLALLEPLRVDCQRDAGAVTLSLPHQSVSRAGQLLQQLGSDPFIVIFPGASIEEKRWGTKRFSLVSKRLSEEGYRVVVIGGREDREEGKMIAGPAGLNLAGMTTLAETAAVIDRSRLVISGDSGVLHLAVALDIRTVSLFGAGNMAKWAPRGEKHVVLNRSLSCSPCSRFGTIPPCPDGVRCLAEITPDEVVVASVLQLNGRVSTLQTSETARLP